MTSKLLRQNYDKPCFYSFKGEVKEQKGDRKEKMAGKRRRGRNKKILLVLGTVLILQTEGGGDVSRSWEALLLQ